MFPFSIMPLDVILYPKARLWVNPRVVFAGTIGTTCGAEGSDGILVFMCHLFIRGTHLGRLG